MDKNIQITYMTDPILLSRWGIFRILRWFSAFSYTLKLGWKNLKYGGHPGVTRSVLMGMSELGVRYNYNPICTGSIHEVVLVMSSVKALRQAINLKKNGKIKILIAGPNVLDVPTDQEGILESSDIDFCLVPSKWREEMYYQFSTKMQKRTIVWASGVDMNYWKPEKMPSRTSIILYLKNKERHEDLVQNVFKLLESFGEIEIVEYGKFEREEFKKSLNRSKFLVALTNGSETQGLVWAEAWAMNVPTFILNHHYDEVRGKKIKASAAPYLTDDTGSFYSSVDELKEKIELLKNFKPRSWVQENMSDSVSAKNLLEHIVSFKKKIKNTLK